MTAESLPMHPILVHFPIATWILGTVVLTASVLAKRKSWRAHGWFLLTVGAIFSIPTALTGLNDYTAIALTGDVELERHKLLGNALPWVMGILVLLKGHVTFKRKKGGQPPEWIWCLLVIAVSLLLAYVGYLGGILVYDRGFRP